MFSAYKNKIWNKLFGVIHLKPKGAVRGHVLLSYLTEPFTYLPGQPFSPYHTNYWECYEMAQQFLKRGYAVDAIHASNKTFIPKKRYDFVIDADSNLERFAPYLTSSCKKILHITICHWLINNTAEYKKLDRIWKSRGVALKPRRQYIPSLAIENADFATVLGNKFTQDSYAYAGKKIYPIPLSTTTLLEFPRRNYKEAHNTFVWIGGGGAALKGLDVTLEAFASLPNKRLFVCGGASSEPDFEKTYWKELHETPNITYLDRIDVSGKKFKEIIEKAAFVLYPSVAEGQSGAIIQAMHGGLIPLISYQTGIDVHDFGMILSGTDTPDVVAAVETVSRLSDEELAERAEKTWRYARENHTRESFSAAYERFVTEVLHL